MTDIRDRTPSALPETIELLEPGIQSILLLKKTFHLIQNKQFAFKFPTLKQPLIKFKINYPGSRKLASEAPRRTRSPLLLARSILSDDIITAIRNMPLLIIY
jgi:hypothetical protein